MDKKEYRCECGKTFASSQGLYGHMSHCREHLGEERYKKQKEIYDKRRKMAHDTCRQIGQFNKEQKKLELEDWISEQHKCEKCGKIMIEFYGTGRFCSRKCANSRQQSDECKLKISEALFGHSINFDDYVPEMKDLYFDKKITYKHFKYYKKECIEGIDYILCPYCGIRVSMLCSHVLSHGKKSKDVKEEFGENYPISSQKSQKRRSVSSTITQQKLIDEGRHKGWQSRNIKSYAEQFWIQVLDNNKIDYQREYVVNKKSLGLKDSGNFFLDFLLPNNIDLEIDGKQHNYEDRKEHDKERDAILTAHGYTIYRIQWINPNSPQNKLKVQNQIKEFLDWYQNFTT